MRVSLFRRNGWCGRDGPRARLATISRRVCSSLHPAARRAPAFQILRQRDGIVVLNVPGAEQQGDRASRCRIEDRSQRCRALVQLGTVSTLKLPPPGRIVFEPAAQIIAGRSVLEPAIETQGFFLHAARPKPIHQKADAIFRRGRFINSLGSYRHAQRQSWGRQSLLTLHAPLVQCVLPISANTLSRSSSPNISSILGYRMASSL